MFSVIVKVRGSVIYYRQIHDRDVTMFREQHVQLYFFFLFKWYEKVFNSVKSSTGKITLHFCKI